MHDDRLPTHLFIAASIQACQARNIPAYVEHRGDHNSGLIVLKLLDREFQCSVLSQMRDYSDGQMKWFDRLNGKKISEPEATQMVKALTDTDPDLWVISLETQDGENPFEGGLIKF